MRINHNIPALRTHHSLEKTNNQLDKALQRLSTGLRINRAADDAAGLAIANKMQTQVRGLQVASRNTLDGVSLVQTAEGALNEVQAMLQRMRELSIQAANGTLSPEDRQAIQNEVDQLKDEITKTSQQTEFNKIKLLNGQIDRRSFSSEEGIISPLFVSDTVQPGKYDVTLKQVGTKTLIKEGSMEIFMENLAEIGVSGRLNINGEEVEFKESDDPDTVFAKIRDLCERVDINLTKTADGKLFFETKEAGSDQRINIQATDPTILKNIGFTTDANGEIEGLVEGKDAIIELTQDENDPNSFSSTATFTARGNRIEITDTNNRKIYLDIPVTSDGKIGTSPNDIDAIADGEPKNLDKKSTITVSEAGPLQLHVGPNEDMQVEIQIQNLTAEALGLDRVNMRTAAGASKSIGILDDAINEISALRSKLGAYQNRLEHTINNLDVTRENTTAAMSRIQDADMAIEMSEFTQKSILAQAGVSMLAQANQRPQMVLQLLQG